MISYEPFWETLRIKGISQYYLINGYGISSSLMNRLKNNQHISTQTLDILCNILNCDIDKIVAHVSENVLVSNNEQRMDKNYFCYKWVFNENIIYIGKTINPLKRFTQEKQQEKFKPYLNAEIWITKFANNTEMDGMEKLLINKYQPILNITDKNSLKMELPFDDSKLEWIKYSA